MVRVLLVALLLLIPAQAAPAPPAPPGHLDYQIDDIEGDTMQITLNWTAPSESSLYSVVAYRIYQAATDPSETKAIPLATVPAGSDTYTLQVTESEAYAYVVTSVSSEGMESGPSNPVFVRMGYPHCTVFAWGIDPPHVHTNEGCLLPPPV